MKKKLKLTPKFIISLGVLGLVLTVAISFFSYTNTKAYLEDMYAEHVTVSANAIASMLNLEDVKTILAENGDQTEAYARTEKLINQLKKDGAVTFLSLVVPDEDSVTFYIDGMVPEMGDDPANQIPYGSDILYVDAASDEKDLVNYEIIWQQYAQNKGIETPVITDNSYGYNYTGVAPILDENGQAIAEIQYILDMNHVRSFLNSVLYTMLAIAFAIVLVSMGLYMLFVRRAVTQPIKELADFTKQVTDSGEFTSKRISIQTGDEIESLGNAFNFMLDELVDYIDNLSRVTAEKERIGAELNIATQIQANMLPGIFPAFPGRKDFDVFATMTPAKEVGGDFYDFFLIDDTHLAMVMADVSGKGVPAALFMVIAKTMIKNRAHMGGTPGEILRDVNNQLCEGNEAGLFVTVWLAIVDLETGKGIAANAGHEHPVLKRANGDYELVVYRHSVAVATMEGMRYRDHEFQLYPGDTLYVYTDGVPEATNSSEEMYGTERMLKIMNQNKTSPLPELLKNIKYDIDVFVGEAPQFDDVTMLGMTYYGKE